LGRIIEDEAEYSSSSEGEDGKDPNRLKAPGHLKRRKTKKIKENLIFFKKDEIIAKRTNNK